MRTLISLVLISVLSLGNTMGLARQTQVVEIESARRAYWEGRFESSIRELEPLLGKLGSQKALCEAAFLLGLNYLALGEESRGRDYFRKAVTYDPSFTPSEDIYPPDIIQAYRSVRAGTKGGIVVSSEPSGATVRIGGQIVGTTPYSGEAPAGEQTVRVELKGYSGQVRKVQLASGETQTVSFKLGRESGAVPTKSRDRGTEPVEFRKIKMLVQDGEKTKEQDVILRLEDHRMIVLADKADLELKTLPYRDIRSVEYSYSKHPRWRTGLGAAVAVGIFAAPIFFLKGRKHWLTVQTEDDYAVLRLDKRNYETVCLSFEAHTGHRVEHIGEK